MKKTHRSLIAFMLLGLLTSGCDLLPFTPGANKSNNNNNKNYVTITFDTDGGSEIPSQQVEKGEKIKKPENPTKGGYEFVNWTYNGEEWSFIGYVATEDMTLLANWKATSYRVAITNSDSQAGIVNWANQNPYTYGSEVTISAVPNEGYSFAGWYDSNNVLVNNGSPYTFDVASNTSLVARWSVNKYNISLASEDVLVKGWAEVTSGSGYYNEEITITVTTSPNYVFIGLYDDNNIRVTTRNPYTFIMPAHDVYFLARFVTQEEYEEMHGANAPDIDYNSKTVTYGLYPQTNVNDPGLISALNELPEPTNFPWYSYNGEYYAKAVAKPTISDSYFANGDSIVDGQTYWYRCEPITWKILSTDYNGGLLLVGEKLLECRRFNEYYTDLRDGHYANNYQYSEIREWLNGYFYTSAFALNNVFVETTLVNNSASYTGGSATYECEDTEDKVFLLTSNDYVNSSYGFGTEASRVCFVTDYAKASGAYYYKAGTSVYGNLDMENKCDFWTRTTASNSRIRHVGDGGTFYMNPTNYDYCPRQAIVISVQ